jgi:probable rRNA maturation factor
VSVFVANEQADHPVDEPALARLARLVMDAEGVEESEVSLLLVNRAVMTDLNGRYMDEERPTDVLAFPIDGPSPASGPPGGPVGPRGFAGDRLAGDEDDDDLADDEQASKAGQSLEAELELLTVHGILHLCGFDHAESDEEQTMRARTDELLARWRGGRRP